MNEIDNKRKSLISIASSEADLSYVKESDLIEESLKTSQSSFLGKLAQRLATKKRKAATPSSVGSASKRARKRRLGDERTYSPTNITGIGRVDIPSTIAAGRPKERNVSMLAEDTPEKARNRRLLEQEGHRQLAKVNARVHREEEEDKPAPEGELQNGIQQHPWLDSQRFDGVDPNLNPEPPLNTEARREYDNAKREQEKEKQLRLGNMPKFSTAPKPTPR